MTELEELRRSKDDFFAHHPQSPLTRAQKREFTGLNYFPENDALRFEVELEEPEERQEIHIPVSTGGIYLFRMPSMK